MYTVKNVDAIIELFIFKNCRTNFNVSLNSRVR